MSVWDGIPRETVRSFGPNVLNQDGSSQSRVYDLSDVPPGGCTYSQNMRFWGASVANRYGIYSPLFNACDGTGLNASGLSPNNCIGDMYVVTPTAAGERYVYTDPSDNRRIDIYFKDTAQAKHLVNGTPAVQGFGLAPVGITSILAAYDASLSACFNPIRVDLTSSPADLANLEQEEVFLKNPTVTSATPADEDTGGLVTSGTHQIGYIFKSRFGTYTKPIDAGTVTVGSGDTGRVGITLATSTAWPAEYEFAYVVMSTSTSSTRYFLIPESEQAVPSGTTTSIVWDAAGATGIVAADTTLESYTEATTWFTYLRADSSGVLPFKPFFVTRYGNRTVYLVQRNPGTASAQVYVSDLNDPSAVTTDQHALFLSTSEQLTAAFEVAGTLIVTTSTETFAFRDTGDLPALWPSPTIMSITLGAVGPQAVVANDNGIGAFVKVKDGNVFYFDSSGYSRRPLSALIYENKFDDQVDPSSKLTLDPRENLLYCCFADATDVALNATPGAVRKDRKRCMVFEVSEGISPEGVRLSEWTIGSGSARVWVNKVVINPNVYQTSGNRGALFALCHETFAANPKCAVGISQIFSASTGNIARDRIRYIDDATAASYVAMTCKFYTGFFPSQKESTGDILRHLGVHFGLRGTGTLEIALKPLNERQTTALETMTITTPASEGIALVDVGIVDEMIIDYAGPAEDTPTASLRRRRTVKADKWSYWFTFTSSTSETSSFFQLTEITSYFQPWGSRR